MHTTKFNATSIEAHRSAPRPGALITVLSVCGWLTALACSVLLVTTPALALSEKEAVTVVRLLEELQNELGDFAYDEGVAADWFEQDAESQGLIAAAGFSAASWKKAVDAAYRGFLANLPETEVRQTFADARRRVEDSSLTPQQRQSILQFTAAQEKKIAQWRVEGRAFQKVMQPLVPRMRALTASRSDAE